MRAPWTVLRDANAELHRERDERAELIALRKERIVLRTMLWTGFAGLVVTLGLGTTETLPTGPVLTTLVATLLTGGLSVAVATHRHGASHSAEAKRADATRSLVLLPATPVVTALIHWYVSGDLDFTVLYIGMLGPMLAATLLLRRWRHAHLAREQDDTTAGPASE